MMESLPKNSNSVVQAKWTELGALDLGHLVKQLPLYASSQNFGKSQFNENLWGLLDKGEPSMVTGIGRHIFQSGNIYEGMYNADKRDGQGRLIWNDGAYYIGQWRKDKRNGKGCFFHANGDMEQGEWKDGKLVLEQSVYKVTEGIKAAPNARKDSGSGGESSANPTPMNKKGLGAADRKNNSEIH